MRLLITGDSDIKDYSLLANLLYWSRLSDEATSVVTGDNAGVDRLAARWGEERGLAVDLHPIKPYFKRLGRTTAATRQRNLDMDAVCGSLGWNRQSCLGLDPGDA